MRAARKNKKALVIAGSVGIVLLIVGLFIGYAVFQASQAEEDPFVQTNTPTSEDDTTPETVDTTPSVSEETEPTVEETTPPAQSDLDPASVATVDVEPLDLTVSYVRGVPGFSFTVLRTQSGTEYVEFQNEDLAGTRCTNDEGAFASVIVGPSEQDIATLAQTITLDETVYGLSLPDDTCTDDEALFAQYQSSFSDAFSLLSKLDS